MRLLTSVKASWAWRLFIILLMGAGITSIVFAQSASEAIGVYYIGPQDTVAHVIDLADPYLVRVDQPELARVLVLNNTPHTEQSLRLNNLVQQGDIGLVVFSGPEFPEDVEDLSTLMGISVFGLGRSEVPRAVQTHELQDSLQTAIAWDSAPPVRARTIISNPNLLMPIITTSAQEPLLQRIRGREASQAFFMGLWLDDASNHEWQNWPYYRYLIYRLIAESAANARVFSYADYPLSPVPKGRMRLGIALGGLGVFLGVVGVFYRALRHIYMHPETLKGLYIASPTAKRIQDWQVVGFHRPLAGFFCLLMPTLITFPLLLWYQFHVLPQFLIPWTHPLRFWEQVARWFEIAWLFFDMGIGVAVVRYFAVLQSRHPKRAFHYFQFYLWWRLLSNALKLVLVAMLVAFIFPQTAMTHLSFYFVIYAVTQFPGFLQVFALFFRSLQRFDYEQVLNILLTVAAVPFQISAVLLFRRWGSDYPAFGESLASVIGLGVGLYLAEWLIFGIGILLYERLGYSLRTLFTPGFDRQIAFKSLGFGAQVTFGKVVLVVGTFVQVSLLSRLLVDYAELEADMRILLYFISFYEILSTGLYKALMPAMAEAQRLHYKSLLRYYVGQGTHYGTWFALFFLSVLSVLATPMLSTVFGLTRAFTLRWVVGMLLWGALQWMVWLPDQALKAVGRPALTSWLLILEQLIRLGLIFLLTPRWQVAGVAFSYGYARVFRIFVGMFLARRFVVRPRIYLWQTFIAPLCSAFLLYKGLQAISSLGSSFTMLTSFLWVAAICCIALPAYGFLTALFGGWDDAGIAELQQAARMSLLGIPVAQLLSIGVKIGARISPLHGRFPMALRTLAQEESQALTLGRTHTTNPPETSA